MANLDLMLLHAPSVYDFRNKSILYGPVSDLVPSTPVFEMYPIGFTTMAEYLERHGLRMRILNLAVRMLEDPAFNVEETIRRSDASAFGIDLHWLPHAHGSIEVAGIVKRLHPNRPVIFGGFSSSYFYQELIRYPSVDFILRGDSTEAPLLALVQYIRSGGKTRPSGLSADYRALETIPNLVWKDDGGQVHTNPMSYSPADLDDLLLDYTHVLRAVVRYRDLASYKPFRNWMNYPITAALTVRGCRYNCVTCGGSACAFRDIHNRQKPAYRSPEKLVMIELFDAATPEFFSKVSRALPNFTLEISMESHDQQVRRAFGRPYSNEDIENTINYALDAGCQRLDLFFMVGLKYQTYESVMGTVDYCRRMLARYASSGEKRVIPFISPLAPFLDPGSQAFEQPEKHGYHLFCRTLEEHRQALLAPSWKYVLNYETNWMNRDKIVASTYEAGRRLNLIKGEYGVIEPAVVEATDQRIAKAIRLIGEIDQIILTCHTPAEQLQKLNELKKHVDNANLSTVCDKRELEVPMVGRSLDLLQAAAMVVSDWWRDRTQP